jgi:hypothetical protein
MREYDVSVVYAEPGICQSLRLIGNKPRLTPSSAATIGPRHPQTVGKGGAPRAGPMGFDF